VGRWGKGSPFQAIKPARRGQEQGKLRPFGEEGRNLPERGDYFFLADGEDLPLPGAFSFLPTAVLLSAFFYSFSGF